MNPLWLIIKKNLKLLVRSKASALIVIFAPLLIILVLGLAYNTSGPYGLNIGIYAASQTDDVTGIINTLQEQDFKVVTYDSNIEECVEDIKLGFVHTCINLPESFAIEGNDAKEISFYLDPSRINLVWMIQETLKTKFDFKSQEITEELSGGLLSSITQAKSTIDEKTTELNTIKEKSSSASSSTTSAKESLVGVDLVFQASNSYTPQLVTNVSANLDTAKTNIASAISEVDDANLSSSDKDSIKALLNEAENKVIDAKSGLNGNASVTLSQALDSLQADITVAQNKLSSAAETVTSSSSNLDTASTSLQEVTSSIDNVLTSLNDLKSNLEGQKVTEASTIASPLRTKIEKVGEESTFLSYLFPALLVLVVMFTSLLLGTTLVMMEKNSPAFLRNYFLPLRKATFVFSTYLSTLIIVLVQIIIILIISLFFLEESLSFSSIPLILIMLIIASSVFILLGMGIGYLFTSEETGILASISLGSILLFVSGLILPIESVSPTLRDITFFNPYVIAEKVIREIFIFNSSITAIWVDIFTLIGYAVALFLIILIAEFLLHKQFSHRSLHNHHKLHRLKKKQLRNEV